MEKCGELGTPAGKLMLLPPPLYLNSIAEHQSMLFLTRKCVSKTKVFLCPTFLLHQSFSSDAPSYYPLLADSARASMDSRNPDWQIKRAVAPFKSWFMNAKNPLLDRIFEILDSCEEGDSSSVRTADFALAKLNLRISESFVLEVLRYGSDVLACLKFFDWAGRQRGFHHTRNTYHAIFKIISRAKFMPLMLKFLGGFKNHRYMYKTRFYDTLVIGYAVAGKPEIGLELLGRMRYQGLDLDSLPYNVLLNSMVENGFFELADVVLNQMFMRGHDNAVTQSIVMKIFCKQNQFDKAEGYLRQLVSSQQAVEGVTLKFLVDSLCKRNRIEDAERLVKEFKELDCVSMDKAYDVWVRALVRAGRPDVAMGYLQELKATEGYIPEVYRYNMFIFRLLKEHRLNDVFDLLTEMREEEIVPDKVTMNMVICFFCKAGMVDAALELYNSRSEFGLTPNGMVYNYLVNSLCGYGNIDEAFLIVKSAVEQGKYCGTNAFRILADGLCRERKFDEMVELLALASKHNSKPNDFLYNKLISAFCGAQKVDEAFLFVKSAVEQGEFRGTSTFLILADGLCRERKFDEMMELLALASKHNSKPNDFLYNKLISAFCGAQKADDGYLLHSELNRLQGVTFEKTYCHMISGLNRLNRGDLAARLLVEMQEKGHTAPRGLVREVVQSLFNMENADTRFWKLLEMQLQKARNELGCNTYNLFIDAAGHVGRPDLARKVFEIMRENGVDPNLDSDILMLQSYLKSERISDAVSFFRLISDRRKIKRKLYHTMVVGLCKMRRGDYALEIMREAKENGLTPSLNCYEELMHLHCAERQYDKAVQLFNEMEKTGCYLSSFVGNIFLVHSLKSTDLYNAWIRYRDLSHETPSSVMLGELIASFSSEHKAGYHVENYEEAIQQCFPLDTFTYNILLRILCFDRINEAIQLFYKMCRRGYEPNKWSYDALVRGLFVHGRRNEAKNMRDKMDQLGFHPTPSTQSLF